MRSHPAPNFPLVDPAGGSTGRGLGGTQGDTGVARPGSALEPVRRYDVAKHQRIVRHRRTRALPWKIGGSAATTGYAGWGAGILADALSGPLAHLAVTGGTGLTALAALAVLRYRNRDLLKDADASWYRRAGVGSVAWATGSAALGPAYGLGALALAAWVRVTAQPWLRDIPAQLPVGEQHPDDLERPEAAGAGTPECAEKEPPGEGDRIRATLARTVLGSRGRLNGVELWEQTRIDRGWRWRAQLPDGMYFSATQGCEEAIAAALRTDAGMIQWEPIQGDVSKASLTVITVDQLAQGVHYVGPEYHDGRIPIGTLADGEGRADAVVANSSGVHCAGFTGDPREGKSNAFTALLLGLLESGTWVTFLADGTVGAGSNPVLAAQADWPVPGPQHALRQLGAIEAIIRARQHILPLLTRDSAGELVRMTGSGQDGVDKILPGEGGFPGVAWLFDEFHEFTKDDDLMRADFVERLLSIIKAGAKLGVAVFAATHSVQLAEWGDTRLQAAICGFNHFAFHAASNQEYVMAGGRRLRINSLPHEGYFLAPHTGREVMGRAAYPAHPGDRVFIRPELHELDRKGAGQWLPTERYDATAHYRNALAEHEAWLAQVENGDGDEGEPEELEDYSGYGDNVTPLRSTGPAPVPATAGATPSQQTRAAILAAVQRLGRCTNKQLHADVPDVSPSSMTKHLTALSEDGLVRNLGYAGWAPAEQKWGTGS